MIILCKISGNTHCLHNFSIEALVEESARIRKDIWLHDLYVGNRSLNNVHQNTCSCNIPSRYWP
jgi:hypothetical protein